MENIERKYNFLCNTQSDINEHLPTLYNYATKCETIFETGVRGVVSSWALVYGLLNNNKSRKSILLNDITYCDISELLNDTKDLNIDIKSKWINNLNLEISENVDLTFIDTWHVYGQLKRELEKFSKVTNKYIIMHDTTVDEWHGETIRTGWCGELYTENVQRLSLESGIPVEEITKGLWPAIDEFLKNNHNWELLERYTNNNGLTVLKRNY